MFSVFSVVLSRNLRIPESADRWAWDTIAEVSDEVGSEKRGDYLLHYEGWSAFCLDDVLESLPPDADVEQELLDAANDRSQSVIDNGSKITRPTTRWSSPGMREPGCMA